MALPTLEKTWQFDLNLQNVVSGDGGIDIKDIFIQIKDAMKGFALSPWTCVGSSDTGSANMSGTDLITTTGDILATSWIVLEQPGLNGGAQVCFSFPFPFGFGFLIDVIFSPAGLFTGGSTSARPTATDEIQVGNSISSSSAYWISEGAAPDRQYVAHVMQSTDGASTKIMGCHDGIVSCYLSFEEVTNPVVGWSEPAIGTLMSVGNNASTSTLMDMDFWYNDNLINTGNGGWWFKGDITSPAFLKPGTEWHRNTVPMVADNYANEISGEYPLTPIGLHSRAVVGQRGKYGHLIDQWFTVAAPSTGDNIPGDGSKQFVVVGDFVFPWDGATTMLLG